MENGIDLSIVVPCYNEEKNIPIIASAFATEIKNKKIELILVNNGSTDGSEKVLKGLEKKYSFLKIVKVERNIGYGFGILSGLRNANGEFLAWTHADLQTPPSDVLKGYEVIKMQKSPKHTFVKGTRRKRKVLDGFLSFGMSVFCTLVLGKWLHDINAQPSVFHKSFLKKMHNPPNDFSFDLYSLYLAKKNRFLVIRFKVDFLERIHGHSSWNRGIEAKLKIIKRTIDFTLKLRRSLNDKSRASR